MDNLTVGADHASADAQLRKMSIAGQEFEIAGDVGYLAAMGDTFEPSVVGLLKLLTSRDAYCLDIGANIGLTACALSVLCPGGKIAAVEPVPRTFSFLQRNVANLASVKAFKHALGSTEGVIRMQGNPEFLAGSFVADEYDIRDGEHFSEAVPVKRLDTAFQSMGLSRLDFIKIDVEGFEIEVFEGGRQVVGDLKPLTFLEMNHWCLNVFRRMSIPEFRERLLKVFPYVFAIEGNTFLDYDQDANVHHINHSHIIGHRYNNLVAGFDRDEIIERLRLLKQTGAFEAPATADLVAAGRSQENKVAAPLQQDLDAAKEYERVKLELQASKEHIDRLVHERERLQNTVTSTQFEMDSLKVQMSKIRLSVEETEKYVEALKRSTSWKLTGPLRAIRKAFK